MALVFPSAPASPLAAALLADRGLAAGGVDLGLDQQVDLAIDERDEMLAFLAASHQGDRDRALFTYFHTGLSIAGAIGQVLRWRFGDLGKIGKLLDFASGYGRVTRFLLRDLPPERVWVADVYGDGVRFQQERFGVHGIVSTVRPEDFSCSERFDAILVTSLFTHLPEERFVAWLAVLWHLLAPGGVLVWSVHDEAILPPGRRMPDGGLLFEEVSESGSLAARDYGSAWVTEGFVRRALARVAPEASLHRLERGLCNFQDLYLAVPEAGADFSGLRYRGEPQLFLENAVFEEPDLLALAGWAAVRGCGSLRQVQVLLDGVWLATCPIDGERPEVAAMLAAGPELRPGWGCTCRLPAGTSRSGSVLMLRVVDERGDVYPAWAGTVESALLRARGLAVGVLEAELARTRERLARVEAEAAREIAAREARIAAMEASRFWKMRNAWFRAKRALGLTREA
jgi:SAM-dependent methyltransferase